MESYLGKGTVKVRCPPPPPSLCYYCVFLLLLPSSFFVINAHALASSPTSSSPSPLFRYIYSISQNFRWSACLWTLASFLHPPQQPWVWIVQYLLTCRSTSVRNISAALILLNSRSTKSPKTSFSGYNSSWQRSPGLGSTATGAKLRIRLECLPRRARLRAVLARRKVSLLFQCAIVALC